VIGQTTQVSPVLVLFFTVTLIVKNHDAEYAYVAGIDGLRISAHPVHQLIAV
jgi:hypothetical protein